MARRAYDSAACAFSVLTINRARVKRSAQQPGFTARGPSPRVRSSDGYWQGGQIADCRTEATSWFDSTDQLIFGSWDNLVIGIWPDGIQILVDPFTSASTNEGKASKWLLNGVGEKFESRLFSSYRSWSPTLR